MATVGCEAADLERIYVAADGSIKALYKNNSLLLLSRNAASFTRVSAAGAKTVQLTECCLTRWKQVLAELLAFRNQHLDIPCVPPWLQKQLQDQHGLLFTTGYPVTDTTWPATAEDAVEVGLVKLLDAQTIQLFSTCGSAYITLQYTGLRFAVCYPLLLSCDRTTNTYTYLQHTQVFSRSQHPARWQHPLAIATAAAGLAAHSSAQAPQQQHLQELPQDLLLLDVTNRLSLRSPSPGSAMRSSYSTAGVHSSAAAVAGSSTNCSPRRCGSPIQQQHRPWKGSDPWPQQQTWAHPAQQAAANLSSSPSSPLKRSMGQGYSGSTGVQVRGALCHSLLGTSMVASPPPQQRQWYPPGSPGSPTAALYAVAEQQQQQQQLCDPGLCPPHPACVDQHCSSLDLVVQLPLMPDVVGSLPSAQRQQRHAQQVASLQAHAGHAGSGSRNSSSDSTSSGCASHTAAALAEALGQRQQGRSLAGDAVGVGSWWLEPHLLLPRDELLHMVWSPDATLMFIEDMGEVEAWLHADDSCLFSFQGGTFITHLQPRAAAAAAASGQDSGAAAAAAAATAAAGGGGIGGDAYDSRESHAATRCAGILTNCTAERSGQQQLLDSQGLLEGCVDAAGMSRVYAASTLPADMVVPGLLPDGSRCSGLMLPLGRIATEALRFRSTMVRVKAALANPPAAAAATAAAQHGGSKPGSLQCCPQSLSSTVHPSAWGSAPQPWQQKGHHFHHQQQQQQQEGYHHQQQQLSLEMVEQQEVPRVGNFTAYADGRVRVLFGDRTILSLDAGRAWAKLILPDGSRQEVPTSKPMGVEPYVQAALEFATWSSHTPVQRAVALRMQALVAAELRSSARMAAICEWGSNPQRVPEAAAFGGGMQDASAEPMLLTAGPDWAAAGPAGGAVGAAGFGGSVESMLAANRSLIDRL